MTTFRICANDLVSLSSRPWNLHPYAAHGAVVGNCLGLLLLYLLYVLEIAQDGFRAGRGPSDLICVRICFLRYLLCSEPEFNLDSSAFLLSNWGLAGFPSWGLTLSLRLSLRSSTIGLARGGPRLGGAAGAGLGGAAGAGGGGGKLRRWRRGEAGEAWGRSGRWRRGRGFLSASSATLSVPGGAGGL